MNQTNFWEDLKKVDFTSKKNLDIFLQEQWGTPLDDIQTNLLSELRKKIYSYHSEDNVAKSDDIFSLIGIVESAAGVVEKKFKEGRRMGQTFYVLKIGEAKIQVVKEDLTPEKWQQIEKFAILGQNLVFKYKNWIKNKQLIDFYPYENSQIETKQEIKQENKNEANPSK